MDGRSKTPINLNLSLSIGGEEAAVEKKHEDESFFEEAWATLSKGFNEVQSVLDRNRRLIQQVNENHRSKIPSNLAKNVDLIREINENISKVTSLYSNLTVNFSNIIRRSREVADKGGQQ